MNTAPIDSSKHSLQQCWPFPTRPRPIVLIGAGGIVNDAHLPAYSNAQLQVCGIFDICQARSRQTSERYCIPHVYTTLEEALKAEDVVFDVAVPPDRLNAVLDQMPTGATVLMQKPMGTSLDEAQRIAAVCREKTLIAAVNFQLRFSPMMLAIGDMIRRDWLGKIIDIDVHLNYREPWELFPFLQHQKRVEMMIVSIHYFDWIRSIAGEPNGVYARSIPHPSFPEIEATRTSAILDYGNQMRCCLSLNGTWGFRPKHEKCTIRIEGTKGAAIVELGCLINYPAGSPDRLEFITAGQDWQAVPLRGSWFPDAFLGTMSNLQRFSDGEDECLHTSVDDAVKTMALIEALYESSRKGATGIAT